MADEATEPVGTPEPPRLSVLHWREVKQTPAWLFNGAAAGQRWETSAQVTPTDITEAEYDAVITRAAGRQ